MTPQQKQFLLSAKDAAEKAAHLFPEFAACEAALESGYGESLLGKAYNNLFGMKQHVHPIYGTHVLPSKEFLGGQWKDINSSWIVYPDWAACFADRMATLKRLAAFYPHYKNALAANDGAMFVTEVSRTWSTDPGWVCSCKATFLSRDVAAGHILANPTHSTIQIPGEGRAEKVLAIYNAVAGDWNAT